MMTGLPRRSISDLVTMYTLEPTLADIYVEGSTDKALLEYLITNTNISIIDISVIDVPSALTDELHLTSGNRQRVMALGVALEKELSGPDYLIRCVIDADYDRLLNTEDNASSYQRITDYSCLESYWFTPLALDKYRTLGLHNAGPLREMDLYSTLIPIVRECFLLRASARSIGVPLSWLDPTSCLQKSGSQVNLDVNEFVDRWLNKNGQYSIRDQLFSEVERLRDRLDADARNYTHGHDLINILSWLIKPYARPVQLANSEVVSRMLACCGERSDLLSYPLLAELSTLRGS